MKTSAANSPTPWPPTKRDDLPRLDGLVEEIEALGPACQFHADTLLRMALKKKDQAEAAVAAGVDPGTRQAGASCLMPRGSRFDIRRMRGEAA